MSRLVVVSNRVALPGENRAGGLAVALQDALEDQAAEQRGGLWFGWSGKIDPVRSGMLHEQTEGGIDYVTIDLSRRDHADYYNGFANRSLWPLLHFRMDLVDYSRSEEHTSELQSLMRISYAVFCLKKKNYTHQP